jgi:hypothetical protein
VWVDRGGNRFEASLLNAWGWSRFLLRAPDVSGDYGLELSLLDRDGGRLSARCGWLAWPTESCDLGTVRVNARTEDALANYDSKILLESAEFDLPMLSDGTFLGVSAGQRVPLGLKWQALQSMEEDYTVSVQLVGPDGQLRGQTDAWPVQGTLPTSQWQAGQRITDPYEVTLSPDAPPGRYRVGVVVYLLATQARLSVVDASGQALGDIAWVGELHVP